MRNILHEYKTIDIPMERFMYSRVFQFSKFFTFLRFPRWFPCVFSCWITWYKLFSQKMSFWPRPKNHFWNPAFLDLRVPAIFAAFIYSSTVYKTVPLRNPLGAVKRLGTTKITVITSGARSVERSSFLNNGQTWVWAVGRPASDAFEKLISPELRNYTSELHAVFTVGWTHSIKIYCNQIGLIWGVGLAGSACHVKGVKMAR